MSARVLFLGGNGMIGSAAAREAVERGIDLTIVTRSAPRRSVPEGVRLLTGDVRDPAALAALLGDERWDAVVNWVAFTPKDLDGHVDYFGERTGQYVFISTCSVFARPVPLLPITESTPRRQPVFGYARDKIACELLLEEAYREQGFPLTIVRPFHTYDETTVPVLAGWTAIERMRAGEPVVVHGDGTSLWTLMHSSDFARAFVPLLGEGHAIGESVNVVSGDILTWDQIHLELARAAGVRSPLLVHRSSQTIGEEIPDWDEVLEHDFRHTMLFDTTKLQRLVPGFAPQVSFAEGARRVVRHHDEHPDARGVSAELAAAFDRLAAR
ncbi:Nucleoside-diphosphate-sugar epimerase [Leifsonia sp. 98AMF]|uniref:NAD-dependent epimerase/dehydratase family protein n=1 Tax=unclassified Leifsonia TaxID=2663824 RepID=UPI00087CA189|nr:MULTISPECIES: NAD-dependent epimerase/dehydratase family protein [unclassified Leifsonia]SDH13558.1 Nucleoside-diphosphate-sugar epimerase [Leifsonia sp. 197AMF]SDJ25026.1 Nucleoside-diphosphate-sugar epimerase [Leifsonia sp. 466MF]SDK57823.1 Nucleoside-diphosphate-sugar epimerase [Leifsonia sp. 157MF]SDN46779.1 Nucleoside-diphosphate-sugar epimerase [Leifsonia sp. 509MF]SEN64075.1 Nucleoside-diphosphate-sugar epimerase [Leifsonia sp. 467MF]